LFDETGTDAYGVNPFRGTEDLRTKKGEPMAATSLATTPNTTITEQSPFSALSILVIAENRALQRTLQRPFSLEGYEVEIVTDDLVGLEVLRNGPPSALILDLRYPALVGWELCREIAQSAPDIPFVILSADSDVVNKILLLEMGAADCMLCPFQPRELVARLRSLIRRATRAMQQPIYIFENVVVDFLRMDVTRENEKVPLTAKEFKTLEFMVKHAHQPFREMKFSMKSGATKTIHALELLTTISLNCAKSWRTTLQSHATF
jgi:DNA-binding response OmpR family regulator